MYQVSQTNNFYQVSHNLKSRNVGRMVYFKVIYVFFKMSFFICLNICALFYELTGMDNKFFSP
uniref:Uncharacterized protein n=1 Tax=Anguilla anguilla TaxID=7936 RepID=A0A0E9Q4H5_ANGAN